MDSDIYKTLEAIGWQAGLDGDRRFLEFVDSTAALLERAQHPDGYLNSWVTATGQERWVNLAYSHEHYCAGHLFQAAVAIRRTTRADHLLQIACRVADDLVRTFGSRAGALDGHPEVETALVELYRETGRVPYLSLAAHFVEQRGHGHVGDPPGQGHRYVQDDQPVRDRRSMVGHAVRALYLESGVVDVAVETSDRELLSSSVRRWDEMVGTMTALTGGHGSRHSDEGFGDRYELPPDRAYNETCAAVAAIHWSWRLLLATGQAKYGDLIERILYNVFAASVSTSGREFFYVNPLHRRADHFEKDDPGVRHGWFSCACCPPNVMRLLASIHHYVASADSNTLYVHQFASMSIDVSLDAGRLALDVSTDYPWSGKVRIHVVAAPSAPVTLGLRLPAWSVNPALAFRGTAVPIVPDGSGFILLQNDWQRDDVVELDLHVEPRFTFPDPRIDGLRGTLAIERGPLVYCLEEVDLPGGATIDQVRLSPTRGLVESDDEGSVLGRTVLIEASGSVHRPSQSPWPYFPEPPSASRPQEERITAIPYFQWNNRGKHAMRVWVPNDV